jgi:hypothetical protein
MKMTQKQITFTHELQILRWFDYDFPNFMTEEGMIILLKRKDEIILALRNYFTEDFMKTSKNAEYLKKDLNRIFESHQNKNYKKMAEALEDFKLALEFM